MKKTSKKKISSITKEDQHDIEVATKYSRLVTIATKSIRKECKIVKSFECQKIVRKMKTIRGEGGGDDLPTSSTHITSTSTDIASSTVDDKGESTSTANTTSANALQIAVPASITTTMVDNDNTSKAKRKIANLEEKLRFTKEFDLDEAVSVCLTRLGLKQKTQQQGVTIDADHQRPIVKAQVTSNDSKCNNESKDDSTSDINIHSSTIHDSSKRNEENDTKNTDTIAITKGEFQVDNEKSQDQKAKHQFNISLIESMLRHKRIVTVVKSINEKNTEYSAWLSQREEWLSMSSGDKHERGVNGNNKRQGGDNMDISRFGKRTKLSSKEGGEMRRAGDVNVSGHDGNSGLFIDSLAGNISSNVVGDGDDQEFGVSRYDYVDEDSHLEHHPPQNQKKKNRQGQRARKAKAMAIEARKTGQVWDRSVNWRKPKTKEESEEQRRVETGDGKGGRWSNSSGYNSLTKKTVSASGLDISKNVEVSDVAMMKGKNWKEDGNAHPSWAAREATKSKTSGVGAVQFTGTKITFD